MAMAWMRLIVGLLFVFVVGGVLTAMLWGGRGPRVPRQPRARPARRGTNGSRATGGE